MRKITSFLLLLFMAMVVKAQVQATTSLVHTASSYVGGTKNAYTSTVDAEKEHINNSRFGGNTWQGAAYAEFSVTLPDGNYSIKSASLAWAGVGSGSNRTTDVLYVNAGLSLDYETMQSTGTEQVNLSATKITTVTFPAGTTTDFTTDVTDAIKAIIGAGQSYIIFKFTNNAGGGDLVGKGASEKHPVLTVELADASAMTTYTVKYVDEAGNEIAEADVYDIVAGEAASISDENKVAIYNADNTVKYIYVSCDKESITTVADAASNVITATFREAETWSYTINAVDGEGYVLEELATGSNFEGETVSAYYSRYIFKDGVLYEKAANSSQYSQTFNLTSDNMTGDVVYSTSAITNAVYFSEAEDIEGLTKYEDDYTQIRMSKGAAGYATTDLTTVTTLPAGVYTLTSATRSGTTNFYAASNPVLTITSSGAVVTNTSEEFTLYEDTEIKVSAGSKSNYFDYLLICRTGDAPVRELVINDQDGLTEYPDFAPEYSSYSSVVYNRELKTGYTYGFICLPFVPDAESLENFQFYALSSAVNNQGITFEEVDVPEASRPYLYSIKEGATRTNCITGGYTTFDLTDPTAVKNFIANDNDTWELVGALKDSTINCETDPNANYAFNPTKSTLHKVNKTLTVYPYTAYVRNNTATSAATMRVYISGPTGIKEISRDDIEGFGTNGGMFDLQGRALSKPVKGQIYIEDGVKKIKK